MSCPPSFNRLPPCGGRSSVGSQLRTGMREIKIFARTAANRPALTPEIRQTMGLSDEIHDVPVAERYPGIHAQAIGSGAGTVPLPWRQIRSSTFPGATCTLSSVCGGSMHPPHRDCRMNPRPRRWGGETAPLHRWRPYDPMCYRQECLPSLLV